jgi:hypothetical protein
LIPPGGLATATTTPIERLNKAISPPAGRVRGSTCSPSESLPVLPADAERPILSHGDDSGIPVPAVFMFVPGMPVVVNRNTYQGLKVVNGARFTALDIILDKAYPGHHVGANIIIHFGPPAAILLVGETTKDLRFVDMPPGTILLQPISTKIVCQRGSVRGRRTMSLAEVYHVQRHSPAPITKCRAGRLIG